MAEAILGGIINGGIAAPGNVKFGEPIKNRRSHLADTYGAVSYTHLTLPTSDLV